ncbi:MAG: ATP-dependent protease, partial [Deltaproteobacteria bacterium]|nr:ATP-dependent protease [Deltaproteobacteria bacterium]
MRIFKRGEEEEDFSSEIEALRVTVRDAAMPEYVEKVALKEIDRIAKMGPSTAEYTIGINYIDLLVSIPWNRVTE